MNRALIVAGLVLLAVGLLWPWLSKLPFGRLPGDIVIQRDGFSLYFPLLTCLILSVVASLLWWLLRR
jgi:formate hydrogenlyase subunit 3/multisubunit Na+/H+ antiporter MnhD subunit